MVPPTTSDPTLSHSPFVSMHVEHQDFPEACNRLETESVLTALVMC